MDQSRLNHTVLIVDDEVQIGKAIGRLLRGIGVNYVYKESGQAGFDCLKSAERPFSLIISDQRMPGVIQGSDLLSYAKEIAPDTIRFLITGYTEVDAITAAVNKGSIHRYITKPWDSKVLLETIQDGLGQYELIQENHRLFNLAKEQNTKLYSLNMKLKEKTAAHKKNMAQLDQEIHALNEQLNAKVKKDDADEFESLLKKYNLLDPEKLNSLYAALLAEMHEQFKELAAQIGFKMPENI